MWSRLIAESSIFVEASELKEREARRDFLVEAEKIIGAISPKLTRALLNGPEDSESDEEDLA
jgi:hypothetical protein